MASYANKRFALRTSLSPVLSPFIPLFVVRAHLLEGRLAITLVVVNTHDWV